MKRLLWAFLGFSFFAMDVVAQDFADTEFYLVDSLRLNVLSEHEKVKLDSCLTIFHSNKHDTIRIGALNHFIEECLNNDIWPNYNDWLHNYIVVVSEKGYANKKTENRLQSLLSESIGNIGYFHWEKGAYNKALDYFLQSLEMDKKLGNKQGVATGLNNIATIYHNTGNLQLAIEFYENSLKTHRQVGNKEGIGLSLTNLGSIYNDQGYFHKALNSQYESLKIFEEIGNDKGISECLTSIAHLHQNQNDGQKALEFYLRSLKISEGIGDDVGACRTLSGIGLVYFNEKKYSDALKYQLRAVELQYEIGYTRSISSDLLQIGLIYRHQNEISKALEFYHRGLRISEDMNNKKAIASALRFLASLHESQNEIAIAEKFAKRSLLVANEIGYLSEIRDASRILFRLSKERGNYQESLKMYEQYIQMRDSIDNEENQREVIRQEYKYDYEKEALADSITNAEAQKVKDAQIEAQEAKLDKEKNQRYALFGGLGLVSIFSGLMYNRFRVTRKQKEVIEIQKKEVEAKKEQVEKKNHEILESINYAKKLQTAVLPPAKVVKEFFSNSFLLYLPRDIVSGDFYWMENKGDTSYFAVADCTGHGVPGAMLSIIGLNGLNRALNEQKLTQPKDILTSLSETVNRHFEKSDATVRDGMDICLCALNNKTKKLTFSGANNPVWIARENEMLILKGDRRAIGHDDLEQDFTQEEFQLQDGDTVYLTSDGYQDQLGGKKYLKMMTKVFRTRLLALSTKPMEEQRSVLISDLDAWKGTHGQTDDVCLMGIRV